MDGIVTSVLNTVLSKYVKKFNKDQVDLSTWRGEAKLTNVEIKPDALDFLNLPIAISVGYAGKIFLQVDWKHLNSKPAKIELDDLRIVCGPRSKFQMTKEMEEEQKKADENVKKQSLDTWENLTLIPQQDTKQKPDAGYTQRMLEKVIDNIHIKINRVHIRYQDNVKNRNFSFGIAIHQLNAVTTNDKWKEEFLAQSGQFVRKLVNMNGFCIYLNTKSIKADQQYLEKYFQFKSNLGTIYDGQESRQYIVKPTGLKLQVIMNKDIEKNNFTIPQIKIVGTMNEISINLGQDQYTDLMSIIANITIAGSYGKYLSYKPKETKPEKSPKKYWKWAIGCIVRDEKEKRNLSWRKFALFGTDRNKYINLYLKRLNASWLKAPTNEEQELMDQIEKKYDLNDIMYFRSCAVAQLRVQSNNKPVILRDKMPKESSSVFSGWFGRKKKKKEQDKPLNLTPYQKNYLYFKIGSGNGDNINYDTFGKELMTDSMSKLIEAEENEEEEEEEEESAGFTKIIDPNKLPPEFIQVEFNFNLKTASLALLDILEDKNKEPSPIMGIKFDGLSTNINMRPKGSLLMKMALQTMRLIDYYKSENMITQSMIQRSNLKMDKPLLNIEFELNPLNEIADSRIYLRSQPILIDLHIPVFLRLKPFFVQQRQVDMHAFERAALLQLQALQNASKAALDDAVAFHKTMAIDVEFYGPTIMLRQNPSDQTSTKLVIDLGTFGIKSALKKKPKKSKKKQIEEAEEKDDVQDEETKLMLEKLEKLKQEGKSMDINDETLKQYYDCFDITVKDIKIYLDKDIPKNHLLTPLNMESKIYSSIFPSAPNLPTIVLKAGIPKVSTKLASSDLRKMYFMMENLIVDIYNEQQAQDEFFKKRKSEMNSKKEQEEKDDNNNDDDDELVDIGIEFGKAAAKMQKDENIKQNEVEEEYFDEKTKLELLQKINVMLNIQIVDIQFTLFNDDNYIKTGKSIPIIVSNIGGTYLYLQQRKWDMTMEAGLSQVLIEDHVCDSSQLNYKPYLLRTGYIDKIEEEEEEEKEEKEKQDEFFKLNLNMVDKKSPKYQHLDMKINLAAGDVILYLRPETIYGLTEVLIKNVLPSVENTKNNRKESISAQSGIDLVNEAAERIQRERKRKEDIKKQKEKDAKERLNKIKKRSQKRKETINMKVDILFSSLQLYICAKQFNICKSSIEGFKLDLTMYQYSMDVAITLDNILLTDETYITKLSDYQYKVIMGHVKTISSIPNIEKRSSLLPISIDKTNINSKNNKDPLVKFILNMYNDVEIEYPGYSMKMDVSLKGMRFTFLNRFVDEMLKWLMNSALLKIPQLITDQLSKSELMVNHQELDTIKEEVEEVQIVEQQQDDVNDEEKEALPQMRIIIENMELIIPKSSINRDYIRGTLKRLIIENDVLNKEDNTRIDIKVRDAEIATRFGKDNERKTVSLFTQPSIQVILSKEFTDIDIEFDQISMQLAKKQYEFLMELLSGNLSEEALVATRVYPAKQIAMEDVISDEQKEAAKQAAIEAGKAQLEKSMNIKLKINQFSAHLLKNYGFKFDPLKHQGKDSLVSFKIDQLSLGVIIGKKINIILSMNGMSLKDVSYDTIQNGVQEVYRDLIAFNNNVSINDKSDKSDNNDTNIPFKINIDLDQEINTTTIDVKMFGLSFTFGSVLYTLIDFANINPTTNEKLPPIPQELKQYQMKLLKAGRMSQIALLDDIQRPEFAQKIPILDDEDDNDNKDDNKADDDEDNDAIPMTLKVDVLIKNTMVKLIRFPKKTISPALVLQLDVITNIKMDKTTPLFIDATIAQIQAYQANIVVIKDKLDQKSKLAITVKDGVPKIITPFDIKANIKQYKSIFEAIATNDNKSKSQGIKGNINMQPMVMRFGYSDFDILMASLNAITPPSLEEEKKEEEEETKQDGDNDNNNNNNIPSKQQKDMDKKLKSQMDNSLSDKGEMEFSIDIGEIRLVLVNDKQNGNEIPLALFRINSINTELYSYKQRMSIITKFGFKGEYWNNEIAEFEPMIEKWSAKLKLIINNDCTYLQFLPDKVLNISFTYSMVQSAMAAIEILSGSGSEEATDINNNYDNNDDEQKTINNEDLASVAKDAKTHTIYNATEYKIEIKKWQSKALNDKDHDKINKLLNKNNKTIDNNLELDKYSKDKMDLYPIEIEREFKRKVGIEICFDNKDYESFIIMDINQIRERTYYIKNKKDDINSLILQATHQLVGGCKEICIHSPIQFINKTSLNFNLFTQSDDIKLQSKNNRYCPVNKYMKSITFDCIPTSDENGNENIKFDRIEELPLSPYTEDASYPIDTKNGDGITYSMMLHTKKRKSGERIEFSIASTIRIENLLIADLSITFKQNGKETIIKIKPGQTKDAYTAYKSKLDKLEIVDKKLICNKESIYKSIKEQTLEDLIRKSLKRWNGSSSSSSSNIKEEKQQEIDDKDRVQFEFFDKKLETRLCIIAELSPTEINGGAVLTFYVPYWIYDLTTLSLIPSEDKTKKNAVAGRNIKIYKDKIKNEEIEPMMFNFHYNSTKTKISVCTHSYDVFSRSFPPDAIGSNGRINELYGMHSKRKDKLKYEYEVGVDINVILGPFRGLIKSIILVPRIILKNELNTTLSIRQIKSDVVPEKYLQIFKVERNKTKPFWWTIPKNDKDYKRRYIQFKKEGDDNNWEWSSYIPVDETSDWTMTIRHKNANLKPQLVKVNITSTGATMYVTFKKADLQYPPYRIENRTLSTRFRFCQQQINLWQIVEPLNIIPYGWDDPQRQNRFIIINIIGQSQTYKYDIDTKNDNDIDNSIIKYREKNGTDFTLNVDVQMFGPTKVLIISDFKIPKQIDSSMLKLKNPVNLSKIFRDEKLIVQTRLNYLDSQISTLDKKLNQFNTKLKTSNNNNNDGQQRLIIQVVEARNLVQTGVFSGQADPYIEIALHSKQSFKQQKQPKHFAKTIVMKNTRNPVWNKEFIFQGNEQDFYALGLDVKDKGLMTDTFMGGATIKLTGLLQHPGKTMDQWIKLKGTKQTSNTIAKNGDVHLKITFAKSESAAIKHEIIKCEKEKKIYDIVQTRTLEEIRKRKELDPDKLPRQNRHRIVVKGEKNLYGTCFDKRQHELFFIIRCGNESRRVGLRDSLFDQDNEQFAILEDFFIPIQSQSPLKKIKMELWVKTLEKKRIFNDDDDDDNDNDNGNEQDEKIDDPLYINKNVQECRYEYLGLFTLLKDEFEQELKENDNKSSKKKKNNKDNKNKEINNCQFDYDEINDTNYQSIRFVTKNINLSSDVNKYLSQLEITISWTIKLAAISSTRSNTNIRMVLPDFGLSVIDNTPKEILYISFHEIDLLLKISVEASTINFLLDNFQIDVQRYSAQYCSLFVPEPVALEDRKAFIHIAINMANIADADNLIVIQYFSLLIQKFQLNIEEKLLWDLFAFGAEFAASRPIPDYSELYTQNIILYDSNLYLNKVPPPPTKFFFKGLIIQPLAIDFSLSVDSSSRPKSIGSNPGIKLIMLIINTIVNMVGNQDKVPLKLNALAIDDAFGDISSLFIPIIQHYRNQGLTEAYKFIGGLDIIGNPVQLVGNLGTGVKDFFYEPINGITESPDAFVRGLGKGTGSLVSGVIGGVFGSVSKVTGTLGKIATEATFDEDLIEERRIDQSKNQPTHLGDGLAKGGISIAKGIWGGVSGLVTQPYKDIKKKGVSGIGTGIGKGVAGLVMKPVAGVLDGVTNITTGIANTPDALMQKTILPVQRRRLPRSLQKHEKLKQYKKKQALGSLIVWHLEQQGLDGRQLSEKNNAEIIDLREREKIMFQQIINNGQKLICGTNYRFFSVNILKTVQFKEWDKDIKELTQVHSIWKATFGAKNTKNPNEERDVTKKVKNAFKKTATLHSLPIKQFQPMHSAQMFGDPAPGKDKVLTIIYTSTKITEKSALTSLFGDMVDTVTTIGSSTINKHPNDFDCLLSSRVVASVAIINDNIKINYYQYHTPSAITNLKSYNMKRINRKEKQKEIEIKCSSKNEADKLCKKINKYINRINPTIERATVGYATKTKTITKQLQNLVDDRDLCKLTNDGKTNHIAQHLIGKKDENELKLKYTQTLTVTYKNKQNISRTRMFEDGGESVELD